MGNQQYVISNSDSDGSAFTIPGDEDGGVGDASFNTDTAAGGQTQRWYVHIDNGFDVNVDIDVQGSHYLDEAMDNAAVDGSTFTVNSGSTEFVDGETMHSYIELNVTPASNPSSGELTVTMQTREW